MKKIFASFFVLGLLLLLSTLAFSFESKSILVSNNLNNVSNSSHVSKSPITILSNTDTVIYNYDDSESFSTAINKKVNIISVYTLKSVSYFNCIKSPRKIYFAINFSRLPRFTYIILRVLRL